MVTVIYNSTKLLNLVNFELYLNATYCCITRGVDECVGFTRLGVWKAYKCQEKGPSIIAAPHCPQLSVTVNTSHPAEASLANIPVLPQWHVTQSTEATTNNNDRSRQHKQYHIHQPSQTQTVITKPVKPTG